MQRRKEREEENVRSNKQKKWDGGFFFVREK